jgi:hypothetical protein
MAAHGEETNLVRRDAGTENGSDDGGIDILGQDGEIICIQGDILLETAVFVVQVVRAADAMLLLAGQTELAAATDATGKADADEVPDVDIRRTAGAESDDPTDALVAADVR